MARFLDNPDVQKLLNEIEQEQKRDHTDRIRLWNRLQATPLAHGGQAMGGPDSTLPFSASARAAAQSAGLGPGAPLYMPQPLGMPGVDLDAAAPEEIDWTPHAGRPVQIRCAWTAAALLRVLEIPGLQSFTVDLPSQRITGIVHVPGERPPGPEYPGD